MPTAAIVVEEIGKSYDGVTALDGVSFSVAPGELFGLIGPDGAGKSSLMRILTTLLLADRGAARLMDYDVVKHYWKVRRIVGYMPGRFSLYEDLTVQENLSFFATIFGGSIRENYHLIKDIYGQIEPFKHRRAGKLSGGMKQKLALSCALIHAPEVLVLDEPTTGVDAVSRREFWEMLQRYQEQGITILVSTPYMDEASLCDRVALIQDGRILEVDAPEAIVSRFGRPLLAVRAENMYQVLSDLRAFPGVHSVFPFGEYIHLTTRQPIWPEVVANFLLMRGRRHVEVKAAEPTIEDCFMDLMQETPDESNGH